MCVCIYICIYNSDIHISKYSCCLRNKINMICYFLNTTNKTEKKPQQLRVSVVMAFTVRDLLKQQERLVSCFTVNEIYSEIWI